MSDFQITEKMWDSLTGDIGQIKLSLQLQNGRIRKFENWKNRIIGAGSVLSILFTAAIGYIAWDKL